MSNHEWVGLLSNTTSCVTSTEAIYTTRFFTYVLGSVAIPGVSENDGLDVVDVDDDDGVLKVIVSLCPNSPPLATMSSPNAS